ncbi:hypothetical protein, partial [Aeromonas veronii]|uniref:hypothetical protein n=1 Tax=Aeromonas veronii TaxID=654 RepID=UPI0038B63440
SPDGSSHAGNQNALGNDGGNPDAESAAITHGVNADPFNLYRHLSGEAEEHVNALIAGYCRILGYDDTDPRRERVKRACIHIYQSNSGEDQILEDGLSESQTIGVSETGQPIVRDDGHHLHGDTLKRDK